MNALRVATYFISKSKPYTEEGITHLKVHKLVYYAQAWHVSILDKPLFHTHLEAWNNGPISPEIYDVYRKYGIEQIEPVVEPNGWSKDTKEILDAVWSVYGSYDATFLENLIQSEDPWKKARSRGTSYSSGTIEVLDMQEYYKHNNLLEKA